EGEESTERERRRQEKVEKSRNKNPITIEIGFVFHPPLRRCVFLGVLLCIVRFFFVWMESWKWNKDLHLY
ncbi:Os09g0569780, partial [Oryza sativa Japonica Group]